MLYPPELRGRIIENLVFFKFDVINNKNLIILRDLYFIDIAAAKAYEIADVRSRPSLIGCSVLIARQNLVSDGIGSAAVGEEVGGVWLVYKVCHVLIIGSKPFQKRLPRRLPAILLSGRPIVNIGRCWPGFWP